MKLSEWLAILSLSLCCQQQTTALLAGSHSKQNFIATQVDESRSFPSEDTSNSHDESPPLPPGRGKWPILGDTLKLLNPKTMGSYQVDSIQKHGKIWKSSVLFQRAVFVSGSKNLEELTKEEVRKRTKPFFPPHHHCCGIL